MTTDEKLDLLIKEISNMESSLTTQISEIKASQLRMETDTSLKINALYDAKDSQYDVNERIYNSLNRIERKLDRIDLKVTSHDAKR